MSSTLTSGAQTNMDQNEPMDPRAEAVDKAPSSSKMRPEGNDELEELDRKAVARIGGIAAVISSLCCLTPVVIVLVLGSASIGTAATLGDDLYYGPARWLLYLVSVLFMAAAVGYYYYQRGICTLDAAKRHRNKMLNTFGIVLLFGLVAYFIFTYIVLEIVGEALGLPWEAWW